MCTDTLRANSRVIPWRTRGLSSERFRLIPGDIFVCRAIALAFSSRVVFVAVGNYEYVDLVPTHRASGTETWASIRGKHSSTFQINLRLLWSLDL